MTRMRIELCDFDWPIRVANRFHRAVNRFNGLEAENYLILPDTLFYATFTRTPSRPIIHFIRTVEVFDRLSIIVDPSSPPPSVRKGDERRSFPVTKRSTALKRDNFQTPYASTRNSVVFEFDIEVYSISVEVNSISIEMTSISIEAHSMFNAIEFEVEIDIEVYSISVQVD